MKAGFIAFALAGLLSAAPALADTINFNQLPTGDLGTGAVTVDGVTFDGSVNLYNTSQFVFPTAGGSICSYDPNAESCSNDMTVKFNGKVKRLRLASAGHAAGDSVTISVFRGVNNLGSVTITANQAINLRSFGRVTKLVFDDNSTASGYNFGKFRFTRPPVIAKDQATTNPRRAKRK